VSATSERPECPTHGAYFGRGCPRCDLDDAAWTDAHAAWTPTPPARQDGGGGEGTPREVAGETTLPREVAELLPSPLYTVQTNLFGDD
jgi:hypothetical protein